MRSLQGKASIMGVDGDTSYGLARHVFKRFPESYLRGVFLACASEDAHDSVRGGMTWHFGSDARLKNRHHRLADRDQPGI